MNPSFPIRYDWTVAEIEAFCDFPLFDLVFQAAAVHRAYHDPNKMQIGCIISCKTGGCPENCAYCPQSSHHSTTVRPQAMMPLEEVVRLAKRAVANGAMRICLGAAWRSPRPGKQFDSLLKMVEEISAMGVEVCCTLGMLQEEAAKRLKAAGAHAYNHNLDTSPAYYPQVITTRTYQERLDTLDVVERAGLSVCCGGIIGLGESRADRLSLLHVLATRPRHPDSVPINMLTAVPGTPLAGQPPVPFWELLRMVAIARILMPRAMVRLSSGRNRLTLAEQALCFLAGANSFHSGSKLLVTPTHDFDADDEMMALFGLTKLAPFEKLPAADHVPVTEEAK